ncbi:hypothetical protein HNY73_022675 [Argiope bruennichi]|uniref:Uncharacterized protein n=1 Tax=Argiope bruennichi TaxID=94029 RepID=A0A8T0E2P4_ARGBR|nr:hypothetical protein HNY73_022675 [Argiope bruennichi]
MLFPLILLAVGVCFIYSEAAINETLFNEEIEMRNLDLSLSQLCGLKKCTEGECCVGTVIMGYCLKSPKEGELCAIRANVMEEFFCGRYKFHKRMAIRLVIFVSAILICVLFSTFHEILAAGEWCGFGKCQIYECCRGIFVFGFCQKLPMPGESCRRNVTRMEDADCYSCAPRFKCVNGRCTNYPL